MFFSSFESKKEKLKKKLAQDPNTPFKLKDVFKDKNLLKKVSESLSLNPGSRTTLNDLRALTRLEAQNAGISSLEGLEFLNGLLYADFSNNRIEEFPNYTDLTAGLGENKNTIVYLNLAGNPFLGDDQILSYGNQELKNNFFNTFDHPYDRFDFGDKKDEFLGKNRVGPELAYLSLQKKIPKNALISDPKLTDLLFIKYILGLKLFYGKKLPDDILFKEGTLFLKKKNNYLNDVSRSYLEECVDRLIPEDDLYLIESVAAKTDLSPQEKQFFETAKNLDELYGYYENKPELLSSDFTYDNGWIKSKTLESFKQTGRLKEEEERLSTIANSTIKNEYAKYLAYKDVLLDYLKDHQDRDLNKLILNSEDFINSFLDRYIKLEDNPLLSQDQKQKITESEDALKRFVDNYLSQAQSFFEQDIFGLEVDMRYIEMLESAQRSFQ